MNFLKNILSSCLGTIVAIFVVVGIFSVIGSMAMMSSDDKASTGILRIRLDEYIPELTDNIETQAFTLESTPKNLGLQRVKDLIEYAKTDDKIKAMALEVSNPANGGATLLDVLASINSFKESGKPVVSYIESSSQNGYMINSAADHVIINPNGEIAMRGYGVMIPFVKDAAQKLGVDFKIFYAGNFKSATEPLRRTDMSPENKTQTREFLNENLSILKRVLADNRKLNSIAIDKIMNELSGRSAKHAKEAGLVDAIGYRDEYFDYLSQKTGFEADDLPFVDLGDYDDKVTLSKKGSFSNKVAVVYLEGDVMDGTKQKGVISDAKYLNIFQKIRNDDKIKAVVLRVNSGGGSAYSSDLIWHEIELIKKAGKPVVASFGDYAASGGYYLACGADQIFAQPNTLTGSIGVFSILLKTKELMNEKLGIQFDTVKTHDNTVFLSSNYDLSSKEEQYMTEMTQDVYNQFIGKVAKGRKLPVSEVEGIAQGRVWTGNKALQIGLVDSLGNLQDAIVSAAKMADVEDYRISEYPYIKKEFWQELLEGFAAAEDAESRITAWLKVNAPGTTSTLKALKTITTCNGVQAKLPFILTE
ncbi:MAG: signal peptide peptidase SppA [Saprospiraceae bacterium]|nr:signal peptide peptidase SppA [Saprospiraceae bacterium]